MICEDCSLYKPFTKTQRLELGEAGKCFFSPPVLVGDFWDRPTVSDDDFCSHWQEE